MSAPRSYNSPATAAVLLIVMVAALAWFRAIPAGTELSYDDRWAIIGNPVVEGSVPARTAFEHDYWHHIGDAGHYRPLATLLLRWDRARAVRPIGTLDVIVFRRTNVALHVSILLLLGCALLRLSVVHGLLVPWFGFGLFALHPACADVVAWISGRTSLVSGLGAALGVLLATFVTRGSSSWQALGLACASGALGTGLALLGKEDGLVLAVALPVVAAWCGGRRAAVASVIGAGAAVVGVAALRAAALGAALPASPSAPLAHLGLIERVGHGLAAWWEGLVVLVTPWVQRPPTLHVSDLETWPGVTVRAVLLLVVGAAAGGVLLVRARRSSGDVRRSAAAGLVSLGLVVVCILPLVQLVPAGEVFALRFLYQPLLLGVFATTAIAGLLCGRGRESAWMARLLTGLQVALLGGCVVLIPGAADVYASRTSYWEAHLPAHANEPQVWNALGNAARANGERAVALEHYERSAELDPEYSRPRTNLGTLAIGRGDLDEAERWLREAVAVGRENPNAQANLGNVLLRRGEAAEAAECYRRAVVLAPGRGALHRGLARALFRSGEREGARAEAQSAIDLDPRDARARRLLAEIESADGDGPR